ncbi:MAG: hypothetical protein ACE5JX_06990 [Acidobacteriota bacterium]
MWQKPVAILLLLWAAVDLFVPGICHSEEMEFSVVQVAITVSLPGTTSDHGPQLDFEDDCFCCCDHITPSPDFELRHVLDLSLAKLALSLGLPSESAETIPHPPRS